MSTTPSDGSALIDHEAQRRDDWWGEGAAEDETDSHGSDLRERSESPRNDKHEWIAYGLLNDGAEHFCPIALSEHDRAVKQTEPKEWVPTTSGTEVRSGLDVELRQHNNETHRNTREFAVCPGPRRVNEEDGFIAFGGPLVERSTAELQKVVSALVASIDEWHPESEVRALERFVAEEKDADRRDVEIVADVLRHLDSREGFDAVDAQSSDTLSTT